MLWYILNWFRLFIAYFLLLWANVTVKTRILSKTLRFNSQDIIQPEKGPSVACTLFFPLCHSEEPTLSKPLLQQNNVFSISTICLYPFLLFYFFRTCRFQINKHVFPKHLKRYWQLLSQLLRWLVGNVQWLKVTDFPHYHFLHWLSHRKKIFIPCLRGHWDTEVKPSFLNRGKWKVVRNTCWLTFERPTNVNP